MEPEIGKQILLIVAKRGYTGADREVFFHHIRGIRYSELEKEMLALENQGHIEVEWVGPSNFSVSITPRGVEYVRTFAGDVWHKDLKALEELDKLKHKKKSMIHERVGYTKIMEEKLGVEEVGEFAHEIVEELDEQIIAERESDEVIHGTAIGVPAVEEVLEDRPQDGELGIKIKRVEGELEEYQNIDGETLDLLPAEAILKETMEDRIEVDEATKMERRVKEKRISGVKESGTPIAEHKPHPRKKRRTKSHKEVDEPIGPPLLAMDEDIAADDEAAADEVEEKGLSSPDFYKEIESVIAMGESLSEQLEGEIPVESEVIPSGTGCLWEKGRECPILTGETPVKLSTLSPNHCIVCQLIEIKNLLKRPSY